MFLSITSIFIFHFLLLLSLISLPLVLMPPASLFHFLLLPPLSSSALPLPLLPILLLLPPLSSLLFSLFQLLSLSPLPGSPFLIELASIVTVPAPDSHPT